MKSWTSVRRPAWAPPPKIWISGIGIVTGASPARKRQSGIPRLAAAARSTASETAVVALPPSRRFVGCCVECDQRRIDTGLIERVEAPERRADLVLDAGDGALHAVPAETLTSIAQIDGLPAAAGRTRGRDASRHGAVAQAHLGFDGRPPARIPDSPGVYMGDGWVGHAEPIQASATMARHRGGIGDQRDGAAAHRILLRLGDEVFHRRLAVDAGQEQRRQQGGGPGFEDGSVLPGHAIEIGAGQAVETAAEQVRERSRAEHP